MKFFRRPVTLGAALATALMLVACGKDDAPAESKGAPNASTETTATASAQAETTATAAAEPTAVSAGQLDFFTERYISADERLLRRQQRIEEVISGGSPEGSG